MNFQNIWEQFAKENNALKFAIICQFIVIGIVCLCLVKFSYKPPIVISRVCTTKVAATADPTPNKEEVEAFVRDALLQRFDSTVSPNKAMMTDVEHGARTKEQTELSKRNIRQRLLINAIAIEKLEHIVIDADRILSVDAVRSAFANNMLVTVIRTQRTLENPYGLILASVKQQKEK